MVVRCQVWIADTADTGDTSDTRDTSDKAGTAHTPVDAWPRPEHVELLDPAERGRLAKLRRPEDRARFVTAAALLRLVVAVELRVDAKDVPIDRSCDRCDQPHGKPRIPGGDLHVSVSHSGALAAVALTRAGPVGIDVEAKTPREMAALVKTVLSPQEILRDPDDFYVYWCRKEAVVKATGAGLRVPPVDVVVSDARHPARLVSYQGASIDCAIGDLEIRPGYAGAIAVLAAGTVRVEMQDLPAAGF